VTAQDPPRIEFPCEYPIKVLGRNREGMQDAVVAVFERHAPGFDQAGISIRDSRNGTFLAMTVTITATGPEQLEALHRDLMATGHVQMVL
jgi:putative lipoic acid-binding regulatory protein